jgi:5-methylcytosine-specific restriction endonuclease McrA
MTFKQYLDKLYKIGKVSEVKTKILKRLWGEDSQKFPKPWVSSKELLELTQQKYFDRRIRELRDQSGCDLESQYSKEFGGHSWRLKSSKLSSPQSREYLSAKDKEKLFKAYGNQCAVCGKKVEAGVRGLQADHKKPISRGGGHELSNWQPLCHNCNVGKRSACNGCQLDCSKCSWAYPEKLGVRTMISIKNRVLNKVKDYAKKKNSTVDQVMEDAAEYYIDTKNNKNKK